VDSPLMVPAAVPIFEVLVADKCDRVKFCV
jgi:hypothetical protein